MSGIELNQLGPKRAGLTVRGAPSGSTPQASSSPSPSGQQGKQQKHLYYIWSPIMGLALSVNEKGQLCAKQVEDTRTEWGNESLWTFDFPTFNNGGVTLIK